MNIVQDAVALAKSLVSRRRTKYQQTFHNPAGEQVLRDLAQFCHAHESTHHTDPRISDKLEGRRQVWLRIQQHLNISDKELWETYRIGVNENG